MGGLVSILAKAGGNNRGSIVASKRFDDDTNPNTPCEWENKYFFYNYNEKGSTTAIIKPDGNSVTQYTYDEFGNLSQTGTTSFKNEVTFTGSISDLSTGLQYMNSRYYDSTTGRFISQDTYTGNPYDPWTQNLYSYCGGNPTNFIDPTGHSAKNIFDLTASELFKLVREDNAGYYLASSDAATGTFTVYPLMDEGGIEWADTTTGKPKKVKWRDRNSIWDLEKINTKANNNVPDIANNIDKAINEPEEYTPQYNTEVVEWDNDMFYYHCFDYVTGQTGWKPANNSSLQGLRTSLVDALGENGFTVEGLLSAEQAQNVELTSGQTMIAMMYDSSSGYYHYMKKDGGVWTHKFEYSAVMNFKGDPWEYPEGIQGEYYFYGWHKGEASFSRSNICDTPTASKRLYGSLINPKRMLITQP